MKNQTCNKPTNWKRMTALTLAVISSIGALAGCTYCAALISTYCCALLAHRSAAVLARPLTTAKENG